MILIRSTAIKKLHKHGIREIAGRPLNEVPLDELLDHLNRVEMERKGMRKWTSCSCSSAS